jgi:phenylalanyl-tRNA synthetase beta subunit
LDSYQLKWLLEYKPVDEGSSKYEQLKDITHPKQRAEILLNKQVIWVLLTLHPYYHKEFKIPEKAQITYLQLDLDKLIELKSKLKAKPVVKKEYYTLEDQIVKRDLSFVISKEENYWKILFAVSKVKEIIDAEVFDVYDLWDEKSISITISIYGEKMTTEDINKVMDKAIQAVEKVWAKLR